MKITLFEYHAIYYKLSVSTKLHLIRILAFDWYHISLHSSNMHVDDMITANTATWSSTLTSDIIYNCATAYLAILITVGVALNSRAISLLIDFNKVRKPSF